MMSHEHSRLYRSRDGILLGVCQGLARCRDLPVGGVRLAAILLTLASGIWVGIGIYLLAACLLELEPVLQPENGREADFYDRYRRSRSASFAELQAKMKRLDSRLRPLEDKVTRPGFDWSSRLRPVCGNRACRSIRCARPDTMGAFDAAGLPIRYTGVLRF
jgi:phage shock protein C